MNNINVLLVDDEPLLLKSAALCLKDDFNIFKAAHGMEAWDILKAQDIGCLVTDLSMPVLNGTGLIEKIREAKYDVKTIMVTGSADLMTPELCARLEVDLVLPKPYEMANLIEVIKDLVE